MSTFNSNFIIEESKKKDKSPSINKLVLDIIKTSNSKDLKIWKEDDIYVTKQNVFWWDVKWFRKRK